jgi:ribosomal protein S18 acetylase RimI-like enzyme
MNEEIGLVIRSYQAPDRPAVLRIAADTAFFGEPVENFLEDRRLFCDLFYRYYTDFESSNGFVACVGNEIAGFILGSLDTHRQQSRSWRLLLPGVIRCLLQRRYTLGPRTWRYGLGLLKSTVRGEFPHCDLSQYPAHLHINIDPLWRSQGFGRRLMEAYLARLQTLDVPGVHLHTTNLNAAACSLYERLGFILLDARRTSIWGYTVSRMVENRCYGLKLVSR